MRNENGNWSSRIAFIIAAIGSAVGVGNIWRFPYLVGQNGGGTFLAAYLISLIIFGIPIFFLETFSGRYFSIPAIKIFEKINKKLSALFWVPFLLNFTILSYYIVITGWTLFYLISSLGGAVYPFEQFTQTELPIIFDVIVAIIVFAVIRKKIQSGLEKVNLYLMPLFIIALLILFGNSISLSGFSHAVDFYLTFKLDRFIDPALWMAAVSQVIFSLGVGYGILLTYGAYMKKNEGTFASSVVISLSDTLIALISGLIVFSIVFTFNIDPTTGTTLAFQTLPMAFGSISLGNILMPLFFFLLFAAAITSAVSMAELVLSTFEAKFNIKRERAALISSALILLFSLPSALSYSSVNLKLLGAPILDFMDKIIVENLSPIAILITVSFIAYSTKIETGIKKYLGSSIRRHCLFFLFKYIIPIFLLVIILRKIIE